MKPRTFQSLFLLATLSLVGIVVIQVYWINKSFRIQENERQLQQQQFTQSEKQFSDRVTIVLTNIVAEIQDIYNDPSEIYNAVEQVQSNFFRVRINDTLHPYLLESLLRREFQRSNIREDFEYAIYDCFTDSLVYGKFVSFDSKLHNDLNKSAPFRWNKDGHYFSVYFPNRADFALPHTRNDYNTWFYFTLIVLIVLGFFGYAVSVILRQKRLSDIKNDFINNMTHELKTPISTISLSSEVLLKPGIEKEPERLNRYAHIIYDENKRLENLVERVLQLATLDHENISLKLSEINVHKLVEECVQQARPLIEEKGGTLSLYLEATQPVIEADRLHLSNILFNLLENARKYSDQIPQIEVTVRNEKQGVSVSVKDKGIGIKPEDLRQVFEKFYRVPTGNLHNVKGFGLGLYYVRIITEQHGGTVNVQSRPGLGSRFTVYFPFKVNT